MATKERRVIEEDLANVEFETSEDVEVSDPTFFPTVPVTCVRTPPSDEFLVRPSE
jgi:hypothetical protein